MRLYFFKAVRCPGDWEAGLIIGPFQLRVARSQFAVWWKYNALVDVRYGYNRKEISQ